MKLLTLFLIAAGLWAQTPIPNRTHNCKTTGTAPLVPVHMPVVVAGITLTVPICAALGPNITINGSTTPPQLEVLPQTAAPVVPRQVLHKLSLSTVSPTLPTSASVDINLQYTPAPGTHILFVFRSSRIGGDVVEVVAPVTTGNTKLVRVEVPDYRPFTADDQITLLYFTLEPAVP